MSTTETAAAVGAAVAPGVPAAPPGSLPSRSGRWIEDWRPEDPTFWETTGRTVARRNLALSILAEHLGFSVWVIWSIVAVNLNSAGFSFTESQLFWLVAVPNLVGATLRLPYTFAVPVFGGRNWTIVSALLLLRPRWRWPGRSVIPPRPLGRCSRSRPSPGWAAATSPRA